MKMQCQISGNASLCYQTHIMQWRAAVMYSGFGSIGKLNGVVLCLTWADLRAGLGERGLIFVV
jgi:hypothetical protein